MPAELLLSQLTPVEVPLAIDKENLDDFSTSNELKKFLEAPNVKIKNYSLVESKLRRMIAGGAEKLMIISDFDFTLTKCRDETGRKYWSSPGLFDHLAKELNPPLADEFKQLCRKYIPIEFDPHLSMEEKIPHMEEFWKRSHELTISGKFKKNVVEDYVREKCHIALRDGGIEMIEKLSDHDIPLVIFSAGVNLLFNIRKRIFFQVGDVIEIFLRHKLQREILPKNMHIISNMVKYDTEGVVAGFSSPLIHTFCKNSSVIKKEAEFFHQINSRTNVLLLGDSLGDTNMDVGVENPHGPTLKIGFLNHKVDELIDHFMEIYDIVIVAETSIYLPSAILDAVIHKQ